MPPSVPNPTAAQVAKAVCIVLYSIVLYGIVLYCIVLYCIHLLQAAQTWNWGTGNTTPQQACKRTI